MTSTPDPREIIFGWRAAWEGSVSIDTLLDVVPRHQVLPPDTLERLIPPETLPDAPVKTAYLSAIKHLKSADFERALSGFIDVVRKARHYDDDGARKACLAVFAFLGDDHDLTREYRGRLASALYV